MRRMLDSVSGALSSGKLEVGSADYLENIVVMLVLCTGCRPAEAVYVAMEGGFCGNDLGDGMDCTRLMKCPEDHTKTSRDYTWIIPR